MRRLLVVGTKSSEQSRPNRVVGTNRRCTRAGGNRTTRSIVRQRPGTVKDARKKVMSSSLCKQLEGAGFQFQVESLEDGVDDSVHALHVDEADHGPSSPAHLHEAAFDDVGGA